MNSRTNVLALLAAAALPVLSVAGVRKQHAPALTWIPGSSQKVEQIIGDFDWEALYKGVTLPTASQTVSRADVLGNDLGCTFEYNGQLIYLCGDTIGATKEYYPTWVNSIDNYVWQGHDAIAWSDTRCGEDPFTLNFFHDTSGDTLYVNPIYPDDSILPMNGNETPSAGITLDGQAYIVCNTGADGSNPAGKQADAYSVLTQFDPRQGTFTAGRTISQAGAGGHFVFTSLHEYPRECGADDDSVLIFGEGQYRASDIYLSMTPKAGFWNGVGTKYYAGVKKGQPIWSSKESDSAPVIVDNPTGAVPPAAPQVGNMSVSYCKELRIWLMTYDAHGVYFAYAANPWGPWSTPQLIFNATRDNGYGNFIYSYDAKTKVGVGPVGPTIDQPNNPPATTQGGDYAPFTIERFTNVDRDHLTIYYTMSTWNPYTVVKMRSTFQISGCH